MRKLAKLGLALSVASIALTPASALTIKLNDTGGVTGSKAAKGFAIAAKYWESVFTNDAVVNLDVGYRSLGPGILGSTGSSLATFVPVESYYGALRATGTSALDARATANLSPLSPNGSVAAIVPGYLSNADGTGIAGGGATRLAPDSRPITNTMALTTANLKALTGGLETVTDGSVSFSSDFAFDFDPTNGVTAGSYDFIGVAVHEIGHALGFVSGADDFDYSVGYDGPVDNAWWGYGLDMFRYSANALGYGTGDPMLDWTPNTASYFSIDGGQTALMNGFFSTGSQTGDGNQASHWKEPDGRGCSGFLGIMNPYICGGTVDSVKSLDLALFDAIGWNVNFDVLANSGYDFSTAQMYSAFAGAVPEPTTWAMMTIGFGAIGASLRRRPARRAAAAA